MQWFQPLAWIALPLVGLPILVHLFSRKPPKVVVFPTLQFFTRTTARPTRRSKLSDLLLLMVRVAVFVAAIAALAQPRFGGLLAVAQGDIASVAIVTDSGIASSGPDTISTGGDTLSIAVSSSNLEIGVNKAVNWLRTRPAPRSLVVRSAFPRSSANPVTFSSLPSDIELLLQKTSPLQVNELDSARLALTNMPRDTVRWITALAPAQANEVVAAVHRNGGAVVLWTDTLNAKPESANTKSEANGAPGRNLPVLYTSGASFKAVFDSTSNTSTNTSTNASANTSARQLDRLLTVAHDERLKGQAYSETIHSTTSATTDINSTSAVPLLFDSRGQVAVVGGLVNGNPTVISLLQERPLLSQALLLAFSKNHTIVALRRLDGIDTTATDDQTLLQWQSLPSSKPIGIGARSDINSVMTHARFAWVLVLLLLVLEWWIRREKQVSDE